MSVDRMDFSWGQCIARATGITVKQFSKGGSYVHDNNWYNVFNQSVRDNPCLAYVIAIGFNDASWVVDNNGTSDDIKSDYTQNPNTFYGQYGKVIQLIKEVQPKAKIFVCTIPGKLDSSKVLTNNVISDMCNIFDNTYLIDLQKYVTDTQYVSSYKDVFVTGAFHLNTVGYQKVAWDIMSYIDYIVRHNLEDFANVAFIGTDYELAPDGGDGN